MKDFFFFLFLLPFIPANRFCSRNHRFQREIKDKGRHKFLTYSYCYLIPIENVFRFDKRIGIGGEGEGEEKVSSWCRYETQKGLTDDKSDTIGKRWRKEKDRSGFVGCDGWGEGDKKWGGIRWFDRWYKKASLPMLSSGSEQYPSERCVCRFVSLRERWILFPPWPKVEKIRDKFSYPLSSFWGRGGERGNGVRRGWRQLRKVAGTKAGRKTVCRGC